MSQPLLQVRNLRTYFSTEEGIVRAVDGLSFTIHEGEKFGVVGESGCGKSVTALSVMRLIEPPAGEIVTGEIIFKDQDLLQLPDEQMQHVRGGQIAMIFQDPMTALNPVYTVGNQLVETIELHQNVGSKEAYEIAVQALDDVHIPNPKVRMEDYPHQLSGGMRQRVMIAMGLSCNPDLLIADEPTTALDVTIQAQILDLVGNLSAKLQTSVILITHDLGVIAEMAERVAVMYAGQIVEQAETDELFDEPLHPYSQGLIASIPVLGDPKERLESIPGNVPNLINMPDACRFADRCQARLDNDLSICTQKQPDLIRVEGDHKVRCWLYQSTDNFKAPLASKVKVQA